MANARTDCDYELTNVGPGECRINYVIIRGGAGNEGDTTVLSGGQAK